MPYARLKPGPRPTSCLTCRKRRKKCDLARPSCNKCLKEGHKCLGYTDSEPRENTQQEDSDESTPSQLTPLASPISRENLELGDSCNLESNPEQSIHFLPEDSQYLDSTCVNQDFTSSAFDSALLHGVLGFVPWANDNCTNMDSLGGYVCSWPQNQRPLIPYEDLSRRQSSDTAKPFNTTTDTQFGEDKLSAVIRALFTSIPPSIDARHIMRDSHLEHTVCGFQAQRVRYWFTTPTPSFCDYLITRMRGSKAIIRAIYLGARLFHAANENPGGASVQKYIGWIGRLEQRFDDDFYGSPTLSDAADCLLAELELAHLKASMIHSISGYLVIRKALPRFLHLLSANPSLYSEHNGDLVVSFSRTFGGPEHELKRFVMFDATATFVLGVPPLVEYGYDARCDSVSHGLEFIHGVPVVFVEAISQVNSWRAGSRVPLDDWQILEERIMSWQAQSIVVEGEATAAENVARFAVQESWRQVALIYIYMGICGVSSHDTRVQASIRQIIQLGGIVADLPIGVHMFVQCVVAGLGARYEKHRSIVRKMLLSFEGLRVWLFRGSDFIRILEHLWHGVGTGGAPITWDDYVQSRCTVAPI